jgi:hypothetical protein
VRSWIRFAASAGFALPALIVLLGTAGYLLTASTIRADRKAAAERRAQVETVRADGVLGRARAYVTGLATVLADEDGPPTERRFAQLAGATADSGGNDDGLWVEMETSSASRRY